MGSLWAAAVKRRIVIRIEKGNSEGGIQYGKRNTKFHIIFT